MSSSMTSIGSYAPPVQQNSAPDLLPPMRDLLERAGFVVRRTRADCPYCQGRSRSTVGFNSDTWHCFRCDRKGGRNGLARQLGIIGSDPATLARLDHEARERERREVPRRRFERWRDRKIRKLTDEYYVLGRRAQIAKVALSYFPEWETAWRALGDFYCSEARLMRGLDTLMCAKASRWLEIDMELNRLFAEWQVARRG